MSSDLLPLGESPPSHTHTKFFFINQLVHWVRGKAFQQSKIDCLKNVLDILQMGGHPLCKTILET